MTRFIERPSGTWELTYERDPIGGQQSIARGDAKWWIGFRRGEGSRWYSGLITVDPDVDSEELYAAMAGIREDAKRRDLQMMESQ